MLIFLDLEETLFDNWNDGNFLPRKIDLVNNLLHNNPDARIGLMSWAVWDARDLERFNTHFRPDLEAALERKFDPEFIWDMDMWATQLLHHFCKKVSREDMFDFFGKPEVLMALGRKHPMFKGHEVLLIDDAVEHNMTLHIPSNNCIVKFVNVDELIRE